MIPSDEVEMGVPRLTYLPGDGALPLPLGSRGDECWRYAARSTVAANAGVALNVGVLSGQYRRERLLCEPHDALLASVADLPALLANWK